MRHKLKKFRINRFTSWRRATLLSLTRNLLTYQSIKTTKARALAAKALVDKLISSAKDDTLAARRQAYKYLGDHKLVSKLFKDIAVRFPKKVGGYTRIINLGKRRGDDADMVILELTEIIKKEVKHPKKKKEASPRPETGAEEQEVTGGEEKTEEKKPEVKVATKERPPHEKKPSKNFLGGLRGIFKKERDSL